VLITWWQNYTVSPSRTLCGTSVMVSRHTAVILSWCHINITIHRQALELVNTEIESWYINIYIYIYIYIYYLNTVTRTLSLFYVIILHRVPKFRVNISREICFQICVRTDSNKMYFKNCVLLVVNSAPIVFLIRSFFKFCIN